MFDTCKSANNKTVKNIGTQLHVDIVRIQPETNLLVTRIIKPILSVLQV